MQNAVITDAEHYANMQSWKCDCFIQWPSTFVQGFDIKIIQDLNILQLDFKLLI